MFCSCSDLKNVDEAVKKAPKISLESCAEESSIPTTHLADALAMAAFGHYVAVAQAHESKMIAIFDTETGSVQEIIKKGHAREELVNVHQMLVVDSLSFLVYDNFSNKLMTIRRDAQGLFAIDGISELEGLTSMAASPAYLIGTTAATDSLFRLTDRRTGETSYFGGYAPFGISSAEGKALILGNIALNPQTGQYVWMSYYGRSWLTGLCQEKCIREVCMMELPKYKTDASGNVLFEKETAIGFVSLAYSPAYVYALYSGQQLADYLTKNKGIIQGNKILQLDWEGHVTACYTSESDIKLIAYNQEKGILYFLSDSEDGYRLKYIKNQENKQTRETD